MAAVTLSITSKPVFLHPTGAASKQGEFHITCKSHDSKPKKRLDIGKQWIFKQCSLLSSTLRQLSVHAKLDPLIVLVAHEEYSQVTYVMSTWGAFNKSDILEFNQGFFFSLQFKL